MKILIEIPDAPKDFEGCYIDHVKTILTGAFASTSIEVEELLAEGLEDGELDDIDPAWAIKVREHYKLVKKIADALYHAPKTFIMDTSEE